MQINDLAELLGISAGTLRNWEKYLDFDPPRDEEGDRFYPPSWVEYFKQVKALLDEDVKYDEIKKRLNPPKLPDPNAELKDALAQVKEELAALSQRCDDSQKKIKSLEKKNSKQDKQVEGLSNQVVTLQNELSTLQASQKDEAEKIVSLQAELAGLQKAVEGLKGNDNNGFEALQKKMMGLFIGTWIFIALITLGILSITGQI